MQVANTSKFVLTVGDVTIEPRQSAHVDDEFITTTVRALAERGHLMLAGDQLSTEIIKKADEAGVLPSPAVDFKVEHEVELPNPPAVFPSELSKLDELGDGIPDGWSDLHANKRKAWIRKCSDIASLSKLKLIEESEKILGAIDSRIAQLEERP